MKPLVLLLQVRNFIFPNAPVDQSPESVVRELYQVVARKPQSLPKREDKAVNLSVALLLALF
jgi:hypothetical protein